MKSSTDDQERIKQGHFENKIGCEKSKKTT